jgi:CBS domain containing-hemolysin-like protein
VFEVARLRASGASADRQDHDAGCQLGITATTLITGYIAEPAVASLIRPGLTALGLPVGLATVIRTVRAEVAVSVASEFSLTAPSRRPGTGHRPRRRPGQPRR